MKIQAIKKLCVDAGSVILFDMDDGQQWIGNGMAFWSTDGITLNEDMIPVLFDLNAKQRSEISIRRQDAPDMERYGMVPMQGEEMMDDLGLVWACGSFYRALRSKRRGLLFVDTALLKPVESKEGIQFYVARYSERGTPIIAAYGDMLVSALVAPTKATGIMRRLEEITTEKLDIFWSGEGDEDGR